MLLKYKASEQTGTAISFCIGVAFSMSMASALAEKFHRRGYPYSKSMDKVASLGVLMLCGGGITLLELQFIPQKA